MVPIVLLKMNKLIKYFYYYIYIGRLKNWENKFLAEVTSSILVTLFFSLNLITIPYVVDVFFNVWILPKEVNPKTNIWPLLGIIAILSIIFLLLNKCVYSKNEEIIADFNKLSKNKLLYVKIGSILYIMFSFLLYAGLLIYGTNKNKIDLEKSKQPFGIRADSINKAGLDSFINIKSKRK